MSMLNPSLPDDTRLWLFAADRALTPDEQTALLDRLRLFIGEWKSHGRSVPADVGILFDRVLAVGAHLSEDELNAGVSGCGIDSLTHAVEDTAAKLGFYWTGALEVLYYDAEGVLQTVSRSEFRRRVNDGAVTLESLILDLTPTLVGELRTHGIKRRVGDSWHGSLLRRAQPA